MTVGVEAATVGILPRVGEFFEVEGNGMALARAQREALYKLYRRDRKHVFHSYLQFRRSVKHLYLMGASVVFVPQFGMWIGIELDGHTHT